MFSFLSGIFVYFLIANMENGKKKREWRSWTVDSNIHCGNKLSGKKEEKPQKSMQICAKKFLSLDFGFFGCLLLCLTPKFISIFIFIYSFSLGFLFHSLFLFLFFGKGIFFYLDIIYCRMRGKSIVVVIMLMKI